VNINGVTDARFDMSNATKDPHWYAAVGGRGWSAANINPTTNSPPNSAGLATRGPVLAYIDGLTNVNVEFVPTSSGSNTVALDEQNYVAFLPVNGVQNSGLPSGDFTGNGARLCGNTTTRNGLTTGPGCITRSEWIVTPVTRPAQEAQDAHPPRRAKGAFMFWSRARTKTPLGMSGAR
jgi:hypothetical protein